MIKAFEFIGAWFGIGTMLMLLLTALTHKSLWARWISVVVLSAMLAFWWISRNG